VKFIRFAEWKIAQTGEGIVGLITNHSYLDNPTFRGMRQHLMETFDEIYVLDLHGNALKRERCPDGSKDENVFDIRQGVAIAFFIKHGRSKGCRVLHAERWGLREQKYAWLENNDWTTTDWREIHPYSEFYLFVPRDEEVLERYSKFIKVTNVFPVNNVGIVSSRDHFVFDFDSEALKRRIRMFCDPSMSNGMIREALKIKDTRTWNMKEARSLVQKDEKWETKIVLCLYRPFDVRWLFYHNAVVERPAREVMRHMSVENNLGLLLHRQILGTKWKHCFCTSQAVNFNALDQAKGAVLFPLFLLPESYEGSVWESSHTPELMKHNINSQLLRLMNSCYCGYFTPEEIFFYIYAVLYSNIYRETYAEFLRIDFPRIPFTEDYELFQKLAALGKRLVDLHLLRSPELDPPIARFQGEGEGVVRTGKKGLRYDPKTQRVYINETQYFEGIPPKVWEYQIGGYQVCHKWLKDRKDRRLTLDEIKTYCRIATALGRTIEIQSRIDELYPSVEERLLPVQG